MMRQKNRLSPLQMRITGQNNINVFFCKVHNDLCKHNKLLYGI